MIYWFPNNVFLFCTCLSIQKNHLSSLKKSLVKSQKKQNVTEKQKANYNLQPQKIRCKMIYWFPNNVFLFCTCLSIQKNHLSSLKKSLVKSQKKQNVTEKKIQFKNQNEKKLKLVFVFQTYIYIRMVLYCLLA